MRSRLRLIALVSLILSPAPVVAQTPIKILFLGDNGHHQPQARFRELQPVLEKRGIETTYTDTVKALDAKTLARYDGLLIYANHTKLGADHEQALLDYVAAGKGFIPLHCASACFGNSQ